MNNFDKTDEVKTFLIPDAACEQGVMGATWVSGSELAVWAANRGGAHVHLVRQQVALFHPIIRKLVNESNGTFLALQKLAEKTTYGDSRPELLKISRQYRAIIRACLENLHEAIDSPEEDEDVDLLKSYVNIFYCIECIWHTCEILYVDNMPGDIIMPQLLEWVRIHFPNHEQAASQILEKCEVGAEDDPDYWNTVTGMIMQGRVDIARALMRLHTNSNNNQFMIADNILRSMPTYDNYTVLSTNEFKVSWKHWQLSCEAKINAKTFLSEPHLEHIMRLICGQRSAMEAARINYTSWWEIFGAWMLYVSPGARRGDLGRVARECASIRPTGITSTPTQLDNVLLALMEDDLHQVLHDIQQLSDNGWLATHLADLLVHCGQLKILDENQINVTSQLRDSLVLDYGSLLASHHSLWCVGFSYLAQSPESFQDGEYEGEGPHRAALLLSSLPLGSEQRVMKLLHEAKKYNLHNIAETICQRQAVVMARRGRGGSALSWALRARAAPLAARLADNALRQYAETGHLTDTDLFGNLGTDMMLSDRLVFLAKYSEFHRLYKNSEFKEAGNLLISLLSSKITPNYFWSTLLKDALPLLESDEMVFSSDDTYEIMHCVEERVANSEFDEKLDPLRLALARNLARTLLTDDANAPLKT